MENRQLPLSLGEEKKAEEEKKAAATTLSELDRVEYGPLVRPSEETSGEPEAQAESGEAGFGEWCGRPGCEKASDLGSSCPGMASVPSSG